MNELFNESDMKSLSPKQEWMQKHGINTKKRDDLDVIEGQWEAYIGDYDKAVLDVAENGDYSQKIVFGFMFEEDAL